MAKELAKERSNLNDHAALSLKQGISHKSEVSGHNIHTHNDYLVRSHCSK